MMNELKRVKPKRVMKWVNDMKRTWCNLSASIR
jgi:hypothetical protein